jgi:beta-glucanase (GH16 family)
MKKRILVILLTGFFMIPVFAQNPPQDKNWEIVFEDNFNSFNTVLWNKSHCIHGDEPQHYISNNVKIENGKLVLTTKKENYQCTQNNCNCNHGIYNYTSGQIGSNKTYKYGYYEIYAKLPSSSGYWPAFWFWYQSPNTQTSNCWYNEIDVFEAYGNNPNVIESRVHWGFQCPTDIYGSSEKGLHTCNYSNGYHWYGIEWDSKKITWYIDRNSVRQIPNNMGGIGIQNPMYIILNVALSTGNDNPVSPNTIFPNYMYVDQANAYRLKCDKNTVVNEILNFNTFYYAVKKSITLSGATTIPSNSNISLRATDFIELRDGFELPLGSELYLDITPCENTISSKPVESIND